MKMKQLYIIVSVLLITFVSHFSNMNTEDVMAQTIANESINNQPISREEAEIIALDYVTGQVVEIDLDESHGTYGMFYVYILSDGILYEIAIDRATGTITEVDTYFDTPENLASEGISIGTTNAEINNVNAELGNTNTENPNALNESLPLSREQAEAIALNYAQGRIINIDFDDDGGIHGIFHAYVLSGMTLREIAIDRATGMIVDVDTYPLAFIGLLIIGAAGSIFWFIKKNKSKN